MRTIRCIITAYGQENNGRASDNAPGNALRDIELCEETDGQLTNEHHDTFAGYYVGHIDDDVLRRSVDNKTPWDVELSFYTKRSVNDQYSMQKVRNRGFKNPNTVYNG